MRIKVAETLTATWYPLLFFNFWRDVVATRRHS